MLSLYHNPLMAECTMGIEVLGKSCHLKFIFKALPAVSYR